MNDPQAIYHAIQRDNNLKQSLSQSHPWEGQKDVVCTAWFCAYEQQRVATAQAVHIAAHLPRYGWWPKGSLHR